MSDLTPFDRGEVLEPNLHTNGFTDCPEDWGNVDFDNDEGQTIVTVRVVRDETIGHRVEITTYGEATHAIYTGGTK